MAIHPKKILSICSGVGALDLGGRLALQGARTVCYVEREIYSAAVLAARMRDGALDTAPVWSDLATFNGRAWRGRVDIIISDFPCQPWSVAGHKKGVSDKRWIWRDIERIIRAVGPQAVFLENVPGLCQGGIGHVVGTLAALGYNAEWGVFSAAETGAPHRRDRLFIYGQLAHANRFRLVGKIPSINLGQSDASVEHLDDVARSFLFPPGPADKKGWRKISRQARGRQPALLDLVDGPAGRLGKRWPAHWEEEVRAVGNSVVPLTVALAFRILRARLNRL